MLDGQMCCIDGQHGMALTVSSTLGEQRVSHYNNPFISRQPVT